MNADMKIERLRAAQAKRVMPLIGALLDTWEAIPADLRDDSEFADLADTLEEINEAMESAEEPPEEELRITAGALRGMGYSIPEDVPDVASVPLWAVHVESGEAADAGSGKVSMPLKFTPSQPFTWDPPTAEKPEPLVQIEDWSLLKAPDGNMVHLRGVVTGHPRKADGKVVITSPLVALNVPGKEARSENTRYRLGEPDPAFLGWLTACGKTLADYAVACDSEETPEKMR